MGGVGGVTPPDFALHSNQATGKIGQASGDCPPSTRTCLNRSVELVQEYACSSHHGASPPLPLRALPQRGDRRLAMA